MSAGKGIMALTIGLAITGCGAGDSSAPPSAPSDPEGATAPSPQVQAYIESWNEPDAKKRTALLEEGFRDDGRYVDPTVDALGRAAFVDHIGAYQKSFPGTALSAPSGATVHGRAVWLPWEIHNAKGALVLGGVDSILLAEDGRIALVTGFFGSFKPAP